jgi:hypothetical protein
MEPIKQFYIEDSHWLSFFKKLTVNMAEVPERMAKRRMVDKKRFVREEREEAAKQLRRYEEDNKYIVYSSSHGERANRIKEKVLNLEIAAKFMNEKTIGMTGSKKKKMMALNIIKETDFRTEFKRKNIKGDMTKGNLHLKNLIFDLVLQEKNYYRKEVKKVLHRISEVLYEDQIVMMIIHHNMLYRKGYKVKLANYMEIFRDRDLVDNLNILVKQIGTVSNPNLALFAEMASLYGRGSKEVDLAKIVEEHSVKKLPNIVAVHKKGEIKQAMEVILKEAMPHIAGLDKDQRRKILLINKEEYFKKRVLLCVNGSHHVPTGYTGEDVEKKKFNRVTRRMYFENLTKDFLFKVPAIIESNISIKYESPKVRPIKGSDTLSYWHENWLIRAIEDNWRHGEILLKPSEDTKLEEVKRVVQMQEGIPLNADYSKVEDQHSLESQEELMEAVCEFAGCTDEEKAWFMEAQRNQFIKYEGRLFKCTYGLLTGRRLTTFINSNLTHIYTKKILNQAEVRPRALIGTGDDVTMTLGSEEDAIRFFKVAEESVYDLNPKKQSWGNNHEFLRIAISKKMAVGYVTRSIASFVCGSWVNILELVQSDILSTFHRYAWTISNRAMEPGILALYATCRLWIKSELSYTDSFNVLSLRYSVNGGPNMSGNSIVVEIKTKTRVIYKKIEEKDIIMNGSKDLSSLIYEDYKKANLEQLVGKMTRKFAKSSYSKGLTEGYESRSMEVNTYRKLGGTVKLDNISRVKGVLDSKPFFSPLKNVLNNKELSFIAQRIYGKRREHNYDWNVWLWGASAKPLTAKIGCQYDDVIALSETLGRQEKFQSFTVETSFNLYY